MTTKNDPFPLGQPGFVSHPIDRAAHIRTDAEKLFALENHRNARAYVVHRDSLVVTLGADGPRALLTLDEAHKFGANPGTIFLGLHEGAAIFGMGISATAAENLMGRQDVGVENLRAVAASGAIPARELSTIAMAKSLVSWHQRHGFCANCGSRSSMADGGWKRICPSCKTEHFPRTDPVVIMLAEHDGRVLLGRNAGWPEGRYSALAGFLEPGESIEEAVRREIFEETGVPTGAVRYIASQPWPFGGSQLMIGCVADARDDAITLDAKELSDAIWATRDEIRAALAGQPGRFVAPPPFAIANTLLRVWAD